MQRPAISGCASARSMGAAARRVQSVGHRGSSASVPSASWTASRCTSSAAAASSSRAPAAAGQPDGDADQQLAQHAGDGLGVGAAHAAVAGGARQRGHAAHQRGDVAGDRGGGLEGDEHAAHGVGELGEQAGLEQLGELGEVARLAWRGRGRGRSRRARRSVPSRTPRRAGPRTPAPTAAPTLRGTSRARRSTCAGLAPGEPDQPGAGAAAGCAAGRCPCAGRAGGRGGRPRTSAAAACAVASRSRCSGTVGTCSGTRPSRWPMISCSVSSAEQRLGAFAEDHRERVVDLGQARQRPAAHRGQALGGAGGLDHVRGREVGCPGRAGPAATRASHGISGASGVSNRCSYQPGLVTPAP